MNDYVLKYFNSTDREVHYWYLRATSDEVAKKLAKEKFDALSKVAQANHESLSFSELFRKIYDWQ